jgi:hypothetical protein
MSTITVVPREVRTTSGEQSFNGWSPDLPLYVEMKVYESNNATLSVLLQCSLDNGVTWTNIGQNISSSGLLPRYRAYYPDPLYVFSDNLKFVWTLTGTDSSADFEVIVHSK